MSVRVLLFPVDEYDRNDVENYDNITFNPEMYHKEFKPDVLKYPIADFMTACNDQFIELEGYWITYVNVIEK